LKAFSSPAEQQLPGSAAGIAQGGFHLDGLHKSVTGSNTSKAGFVTTHATSAKETLSAHHDAYSLSSDWDGQGGGLTGTAKAAVAAAQSVFENVSMPPISQDRFEPFGYPGAGLLLELHLPKVTLRDLHNSGRSSLAQFLSEVRVELGKAAEVQEQRISILGIHGRYKRQDSARFYSTHNSHDVGVSSQPRTDEEVVVRFEILPGWSNDTDPRQALSALNHQLNSPNGVLMQGPLGSTLDSGAVTLSTPVGLASMPSLAEHRGLAHMTIMAWPIGISAAFIGVLIWLAAY
jgi:hypothetical protein